VDETSADANGNHGSLVGRPVAEVAERVAPDRDPDEVRTVLDPLTEDGRMTEAAMDEALSDTSKVVSTAESRTEFAGIEMDEARKAAADAPPLDAVQSRLETFEARLEGVEARAEDLTPQLQLLVRARRDERVYELATGLVELTSEAEEVSVEADDLKTDLEEFERWLDGPERRYDELEADLDPVESTLDTVAEAVDGLEAGTADDSAAVWADATLRQRLVTLLLADLRAELADLRAWDTREGLDDMDHSYGTLEERLDDLNERVSALGARLGTAAEPAWRERYGAHVESFEAELEGVEPPVPWGEVGTSLERHREAVLEGE
jgi:chromosome segregation ATPase